MGIRDIATRLGRSEVAIEGRASVLKIPRPEEFYHRKAKAAWEADNIKVFQEVTSRSHRKRLSSDACRE